MMTSLISLILAQPPSYANPSLLIEPVALKNQSTKCLVLDVRARDLYDKSHRPGAVWVDIAAWSKAFQTEPDDVAHWTQRVGAAGIDSKIPIIVMGDVINESARLWWILRYWGIPDVRLVNGGWSAYAALSPPLTTAATVAQPTSPQLTPHRERLAKKDQIVEFLRESPPQIVDARTTGEYCGAAETAKRNGSIPGAIHLEWTEAIDPKSKRFKSPAELVALLADRKIDVNKPTITYCQSGGRAAALAFTLELMGGKQVSNYYRSWSDWGNDPQTPVAKPVKK